MNFVRFLRKILNKKEKFSLVYIFLLMIFNSCFELLSIGIILPVITILFKKDFSFIPEKFNELLKGFENIDLIKYAIIGLIMVYLIKNLFILFYNYQQKLYLRNLQSRILGDLYKLYIFQNYSFFLQNNTGTILRNLQTSRVVSLCLVSYLTIILEILIAIIFITYLLYINFIVTGIILLLFFIFGSILYLSSKNKLFTWAKLRQHLDAKINQLIIQSFNLIKNVKIFNKEKKMYLFFKKLIFEFENLDFKIDIVQQIPRALIEMIGVISISFLIIVLSNSDKDSVEIFGLIALYAAVAFRLMPSATRIIAAGQRIRSFAPDLNLIENEFLDNRKNISEVNNEKIETLKFKNLKFKNVSFFYDKNEKNILTDINLEINKGEVIGVYGESGSGKSTFVNLISGLLKPQTGTIQINNENLENKKQNWLASLGYVPQQVTLFNDTIETNISFFENQNQNEIFNKKITKVLEQANLKNLIESLPDKVNTIVGENAAKLSGGQVQRIGIARALFHDPEFIIFDESTSSLDFENEADIMRFVFSLKKHKTVIFISHKKEILERCDKIFEVKNNRINQIK